MDGGSVIPAPCGRSSFAGASRAPLLPAAAGPTTIRPTHLSVVQPSAPRSKAQASSTATSCCSRSTPCPCDEDPAIDLKKNAAKMKAPIGTVYSMHNIFEVAPSKEEAEAAVSSLNMVSLPTICSQFVGHDKISLSGTSSSDQSKLSKSVLSQAQHKVLNALQLLRDNPSVRSMVISLSSDKAVWNAVMKNEMVQEFTKSYHADEYLKYVESEPGIRLSTAEHPDIVSQILGWIFEFAKGKVMHLLENIIDLVTKLFYVEDNAAEKEIVSDLVRSSFMASVLIFIIVVLKRIASSY